MPNVHEDNAMLARGNIRHRARRGKRFLLSISKQRAIKVDRGVLIRLGKKIDFNPRWSCQVGGIRSGTQLPGGDGYEQ